MEDKQSRYNPEDVSLQNFKRLDPDYSMGKDNSASAFDNPSFKDGKIGLPSNVKAKDEATPEDAKSEETKRDKKEEQAVGLGLLFRFATAKDKVLMLFAILFSCAHGACLPVLLIVFGDMTDLFVNSAGDTAACDTYDEEQFLNATDELRQECGVELNTQLLKKMRTYSLYYVYVGLVVIAAAYGQIAFWLMAAYRQSQKIRTTLFRAIMRQEISWFDTHEAGELNTRLVDDVTKIEEGIGDKLGNFFQWFSTFISGFVIGFVHGWKLCLVILATSPLLVICGFIFTKLSSLATEDELSAYAKAGAVAQEVLSCIRTVFAFSGQEKEAQRYRERLDDAKKFGIKKAIYNGGAMGAVFFIIYAIYALAFWYGAKLVREDDNYTIGNVLIVFFAVLFGAFALGNAAPNLQNLATARGAAFFIYSLIEREPEIDSLSQVGDELKEVIGNITIRDVDFIYPARSEVQVLNKLSLEVTRGQTAALVGHSGCGKSTVVQLLQRFYDPKEGSVMIDGRDIREFNVRSLRQHIGVVSQEPVLFATTIKENIMFGREDVTMAEIEEATKQSNAYDFIMKLPQKFDTLVGERGAQMSGGQKQRIAIARALVKNPKILLLDEATSALDTESEATVQEALERASEGRTTIVVAHRLSTIKNADVIFGLKDGAVHESGSHDQLMAIGKDGIYYQLVTNQQTMDLVQQEIEEEIDELTLLESDVKMREPSVHRAVSHSVSVVEKTAEKAPAPTTAKEEDLPPMPFGRVMKLNAPEWPYMAFGCFCAMINGAVQPAFAVIFAEIIGVFAKPADEQEEEVLLWSMMFLVIGVCAGLSMLFQALMFGISGEKLTLRVRDLVFQAFLRQEVAYYDDHNNTTGALCTRLSTDASAVQGATGARIGTLLQNLAAIGTGVVIGFIYSWKLSLLVIAFVPLIAIAAGLQLKILKGTASQGREALEEAGKTVTEVILNIRTVAQLTKEPYFLAEYENQTLIPHRNAMRKCHVVGITFSFSQALIFFAYAATFYLGAYLVEEEGLHFEDMFKVFASIIFGAMAMGQASHFAPDYAKATTAGARIFALLDRKPAIDSSKDGIKPAAVKGVIQLRGVHFHYPTRDTVQVLQGLDLDILPGQSVAFVGTSGCGKSTVVSLLERFYDATEGEAKLDGQNIQSLNIGWLREQMAIVQQEPILFDKSIRENIAYGMPDSNVPMDDVIKAAREANIHEFIASLPDGYETNVGEKGTQLSGGQKQRVAIARALIRNPKILLLDEATSALDTESEKVVQEALDRAQEGRTSIVIAHRLSTIQHSDCIFVIRNGKVYEKGTHSDLLASKGIYYKLNMAQQKKSMF